MVSSEKSTKLIWFLTETIEMIKKNISFSVVVFIGDCAFIMRLLFICRYYGVDAVDDIDFIGRGDFHRLFAICTQLHTILSYQ